MRGRRGQEESRGVQVQAQMQQQPGTQYTMLRQGGPAALQRPTDRAPDGEVVQPGPLLQHRGQLEVHQHHDDSEHVDAGLKVGKRLAARPAQQVGGASQVWL
jgi:hypothetical protein